MKVIPLIDSPHQLFNILLDEQEITMRLYQRNSSLYIDITKGDECVCYGQKCISGRSIITFSQNIFKGSLHFIDIITNGNPLYNTLNSQHFLIFLSEDEELPEICKY